MIGYLLEPHRGVRDGAKLCGCGEARSASYAFTVMDHRWERLYLCSRCAKEVRAFLEGEPVEIAQPAQRRITRQGKLTDAQVREVRILKAKGYMHGDIAAMFGIAPNTVSEVAAGKRYAHVDAELAA